MRHLRFCAMWNTFFGEAARAFQDKLGSTLQESLYSKLRVEKPDLVVLVLEAFPESPDKGVHRMTRNRNLQIA